MADIHDALFFFVTAYDTIHWTNINKFLFHGLKNTIHGYVVVNNKEEILS